MRKCESDRRELGRGESYVSRWEWRRGRGLGSHRCQFVCNPQSPITPAIPYLFSSLSLSTFPFLSLSLFLFPIVCPSFSLPLILVLSLVIYPNPLFVLHSTVPAIPITSYSSRGRNDLVFFSFWEFLIHASGLVTAYFFLVLFFRVESLQYQLNI